MPEIVPPTFQAPEFHCPYDECGVYAHQYWSSVFIRGQGGGFAELEEWSAAVCRRCTRQSFWYKQTLVYPAKYDAEPPHPDMPAEVLAIYDEARAVSPHSRRAAAGLLRLGLQMLVDELEQGSGDINTKIGALVQKGLDPTMQRAMDVLRVVGNEAVHPGTIDLDADDSLLPGLFRMINIVVEQVVTRSKEASSLFGILPPEKVAAIERRDGPKQ
jgi:hypothetical protein